jgi:hypothetical protein
VNLLYTTYAVEWEHRNVRRRARTTAAGDLVFRKHIGIEMRAAGYLE